MSGFFCCSCSKDSRNHRRAFLDIPNFDDFMDIIRLEESSSSQKLSDVLRNANVFDDSTESEDDAGEDSIAVLYVR